MDAWRISKLQCSSRRGRQAELDILPAPQQFSILFCVFGRTKTDRITIGPNVGTASVLFQVSRSNAANAGRAVHHRTGKLCKVQQRSMGTVNKYMYITVKYIGYMRTTMQAQFTRARNEDRTTQ